MWKYRVGYLKTKVVRASRALFYPYSQDILTRSSFPVKQISMSTTPHKARILSLYRSFLRELPPSISPKALQKRSPLHQRLRESFSSSPLSSTAPLSHAIEQGEQYLQYFQSQRQYAMLLERYNPGISGEMDEEERVRLSARRVGMNMPEDYRKT